MAKGSRDGWVQIYALHLDDSPDDFRYIGKANNAEKRFKSHMSETRRRHYPLYAWMRKHLSQGKPIKVAVIAHAKVEEWPEVERLIIAQWQQAGCELLNVAEGGNQPHCPKEVRAANGRKNAQNRNKEMWKLKQMLGVALKQGRVSEELRARMRQAAIDKPWHFACWANV